MHPNISRKDRIYMEAQIMAKDLPQFSFYDPEDKTHVMGWQSSSSGRVKLQFKLVLGPSYPDEMPCLYVISPHTLRQFDQSKTINDEGGNFRFHTHLNGPNGEVNVCHHRNWDPSYTCLGVMLKAIIWCEAYAAHLITGEDIYKFCSAKP